MKNKLFEKIASLKMLLHTPSYMRTLAIIGILLVALIIPVTVVVLQQKTNTQQHASSTTACERDPYNGSCVARNICSSNFAHCQVGLGCPAGTVCGNDYTPPTPTPISCSSLGGSCSYSGCTNGTLNGVCSSGYQQCCKQIPSCGSLGGTCVNNSCSTIGSTSLPGSCNNGWDCCSQNCLNSQGTTKACGTIANLQNVTHMYQTQTYATCQKVVTDLGYDSSCDINYCMSSQFSFKASDGKYKVTSNGKCEKYNCGNNEVQVGGSCGTAGESECCVPATEYYVNGATPQYKCLSPNTAITTITGDNGVTTFCDDGQYCTSGNPVAATSPADAKSKLCKTTPTCTCDSSLTNSYTCSDGSHNSCSATQMCNSSGTKINPPCKPIPTPANSVTCGSSGNGICYWWNKNSQRAVTTDKSQVCTNLGCRGNLPTCAEMEGPGSTSTSGGHLCSDESGFFASSQCCVKSTADKSVINPNNTPNVQYCAGAYPGFWNQIKNTLTNYPVLGGILNGLSAAQPTVGKGMCFWWKDGAPGKTTANKAEACTNATCRGAIDNQYSCAQLYGPGSQRLQYFSNSFAQVVSIPFLWLSNALNIMSEFTTSCDQDVSSPWGAAAMCCSFPASFAGAPSVSPSPALTTPDNNTNNNNNNNNNNGGNNNGGGNTCQNGQATSFALNVKLEGIGAGQFENNSPAHPNRSAAVTVTDSNGNRLYGQSVQFTYSNGTFNSAKIALGTSLTCGNSYTVKTKLNGYLTASATVTYGQDQTITMNPIQGDINKVDTNGNIVGDDKVGIEDYAFFRDDNCPRGVDPNKTLTFGSGSTTVQVKCSDLINFFDYPDGGTQTDEWSNNYNLWLRGFIKANP